MGRAGERCRVTATERFEHAARDITAISILHDGATPSPPFFVWLCDGSKMF